MAVPGIDVSKNQSTRTDWNAVHAAGHQFAYIKATEGIGYSDPSVADHLNGARGARLATGLYHLARPDTGNSPQDDAQTFAHELQRFNAAGPGNLPPCLDIEREGDDLPNWVHAFVDAIRGHTGRNEVIVYANLSYFQNKLNPDVWLDPGVFLWIADYSAPPGQPRYQSDRVALHQHSEQGQCAGVPGSIDLDVATVDLAVLTGTGSPAPPPGNPPAPETPPPAGNAPPEGGAPPPGNNRPPADSPPPAPAPPGNPPQGNPGAGNAPPGNPAPSAPPQGNPPPGPPPQGAPPPRSTPPPAAPPPGQAAPPGNSPGPPPASPGTQPPGTALGNSTTYSVCPGDTLAAIADQFGVTWQDVARANGIADPNRIYVGQTLQLPH